MNSHPSRHGLTEKALTALQRPVVHRIARFIEDRLATTLPDLTAQTGLGTATVHEGVNLLLKAGVIQAHTDSGSRTIYTVKPGIVIPNHPPFAPGGLRDRIARAIHATPGSTTPMLAQRVGCRARSVHFHVRALSYSGLVQVNLAADGEHYLPTPELAEILGQPDAGPTPTTTRPDDEEPTP